MVEVVAALIWDNDKFMICQRPAHKTRGLLWEFVGGKVENGETKQQALMRECREELDVELCVGDVYTEVVHHYSDLDVQLTLFNATVKSGEPKKIEHNDIRWITPAEIDQYAFCPADREILLKLQGLPDISVDEMRLTEFFKSIIDQDSSEVVICNTQHTIIYMNPAAKAQYAKYGGDTLVGRNLLNCHSKASAQMIEKILAWFAADKANNKVHTFYNEKQNKDVYMVALRDKNGALIGYYEKHEMRNRDSAAFYCMPDKDQA